MSESGSTTGVFEMNVFRTVSNDTEFSYETQEIFQKYHVAPVSQNVKNALSVIKNAFKSNRISLEDKKICKATLAAGIPFDDFFFSTRTFFPEETMCLRSTAIMLEEHLFMQESPVLPIGGAGGGNSGRKKNTLNTLPQEPVLNSLVYYIDEKVLARVMRINKNQSIEICLIDSYR